MWASAVSWKSVDISSHSAAMASASSRTESITVAASRCSAMVSLSTVFAAARSASRFTCFAQFSTYLNVARTFSESPSIVALAAVSCTMTTP